MLRLMMTISHQFIADGSGNCVKIDPGLLFNAVTQLE
jgi:hypothetical protein